MNIGSPPLPTEPTSEEVADWAELVALKNGKLGRGNLSSEVARNDGTDRLVADAWQELETRAELSKSQWAFKVSTTQLVRRSNNSDEHVLPAFLAALGLRENIENSHRELFEQCVSELVHGLVPRALRIGFPRRPPVNPSFAIALADYANECHEAIQAPPPPSDNDLKMDVVGWRDFSDGRGCYAHIVGQCATGADWESKLDELNLDVVADHLKWAVRPMRFFATPHVVAPQHLRRVSMRAGLVLDRPRLLELELTAQLRAATRKEVVNALSDLY